MHESKYFSAEQAVGLFKHHNGHFFPTSVPEHFLSRRRAVSARRDEQGRALFSRIHWNGLWKDMCAMAQKQAVLPGQVPLPVQKAPSL